MSDKLNPANFIITRKRKLYKFALFANSPLCFELEEWKVKDDIEVLELGAGTGLFSVERATLHPDRQFLAVDVKGDRLIKGAREVERRSLTNISFLRARADQLPDVIAPHTLRELWITFPDPFPKVRSARRRMTHAHYLSYYQQCLTTDGGLYLKTDAHDLFDWSLEQLVSQDWRIDELSFDLHESSYSDEYKIKTTYETRFTAEGLVSYFVRAQPPRELD